MPQFINIFPSVVVGIANIYMVYKIEKSSQLGGEKTADRGQTRANHSTNIWLYAADAQDVGGGLPGLAGDDGGRLVSAWL